MTMLQGIEATGAIPGMVPADVLPPNPAVSQIDKPEMKTAVSGEQVATANQVPKGGDPSLGQLIDAAA